MQMQQRPWLEFWSLYKKRGGEGNKVVIRGLSPKYNKITVNGTNLASTDADDRSTDLSMISQYMLKELKDKSWDP